MIRGNLKCFLKFFLFTFWLVINLSIWFILDKGKKGDELIDNVNNINFSLSELKENNHDVKSRTYKDTKNKKKELIYTMKKLREKSLQSKIMSDKEIEEQKCKIPKFDAYHPQILPHVRLENVKPRELKRVAKIMNNTLYFKLKDIERAGFYYIRRFGDFQSDLSKWNTIIADEDAKGEQGCMKNKKRKCIIQFDEINSILAASCTSQQECKAQHKLYMQYGRIIHAKTGMCLVPDRCHEENFDYSRNDLRDIGGVKTWKICQSHCKNDSLCNAWLHNYKDQACWIKSSDENRRQFKGASAGIKLCLGSTPQRLILSNVTGCANDVSLFETLSNPDRLRHVESRKCISVNPDTGIVTLIKCDDPTTHFTIPPKFKFIKDVDVSFHLTEEFIQFEYTQNGEKYTEFHSHVIQNDLKYPNSKRTGDELNIVMIMIDSQSNKNMERKLRKTYRDLNGDPNTVILQNHAISGDGTSANLAPILAGHHIADLPESRHWFRGSVFLNEWPLIFKELHHHGYVTMYSDDNPILGGLQFRLKGFQKQPTDKYLLPFFYTSSGNYDWGHKYSYEYLKSFHNSYHRSFKSFAFLSLGFAHNDMNRANIADDDTLDILKYLNDTDNTAIFLFGDHGSRASSLRKTIWGKLEERLPFMSITMPSWFSKKYKSMMENLKANAHVLTSHFDVYQTLRHMLSLSNYNKSRDIGKSVFDNIVRLNRTCGEAGIPMHYCPCLEFKPVLTNSTIVIKIGEKVVTFINEMLRNNTLSKSLCATLKLRNIVRAQIKVPNEKMKKYKESYETFKCDRCGIKYDQNFTMQVTSYEIVLSVDPSDGLYETTVEYLHDTNTIRVTPDISRINMYGDQPKCIAKRYPGLRKYCFCRQNS